MQKIINLNAADAKAILERRKHCFFQAVEFPFFVNSICNGKPVTHKYANSFSEVTTVLNYNDKSYPEELYHPDDILLIKEPWRASQINIPGTTRIEFEAGGIKAVNDVVAVYDGDNWHKPADMPYEAIRSALRVTKVEVKRIQDVTVEDILNAGLDVEMPPICKQQLDPNWPSDEEKTRYNALSPLKQEEYVQNRARAAYIGWCDYADNLLTAFRKDWNNRLTYGQPMFLSYSANPYVWHVNFELIPKEELHKWL